MQTSPTSILGLPRKRKSGDSIHINPAHKGRLHAAMHVAEGQKIPVKALEAAKKSASPAERKQANFALNARKWGH